MQPTYADFLIARKKYLAEKAGETTRVKPFWNRELIKIIALDAAIVAGFALLAVFPNFVTGIVLCSVVVFCFYASHTRKTEEEHDRDRKRFWERMAIGYVVGRVSRGKDIL